MAEYEGIFARFCEEVDFAPAKLAPLQAMVAAVTQRCPGTVLHVLDILRSFMSPANSKLLPDQWQGACCKHLGSDRFTQGLVAIRSFPR